MTNLAADIWIPISERLPESGERVLVYWLEFDDLHQVHVLAYYCKGEIVRDETHPIDGTPNERLLDVLFGKRGDKAIEQGGFYIYDCVDDTGLCKWRRHNDCITHWRPLPAPPERIVDANKTMEESCHD